jgi:prevent-host-death family protein
VQDLNGPAWCGPAPTFYDCATIEPMEQVGIRELKQNASGVMRRVAAGEIIEVTDRGKPLGRIVPTDMDPLTQLVAEGRAVPASLDLLSIEAEPAEPTESSPYEALMKLRQDER